MIELLIHSEDPAIIDMCERYWQLDGSGNFVGTVRQIAEDHGLNQRELREVVKANCIARSFDVVCERCGDPYVFSSRSDYQSSSYERRDSRYNQLCQNCQTEVAEERRLEHEQARAEREAALRRQQQEKRLAILEMFSSVPEQLIDPRRLTLEDAVYLLSVVRFGATEDFNEIRPLINVEGSLAPTADFSREILTHLYARGLISIHPGSDPGAFVFEEGEIHRYYPASISWRLAVGRDTKENQQVIADLESAFAQEDWPEPWQDEWLPLWRTIALHECLEYLNVCMEDRGFKFNPGEKTVMVFNQLLDSFSVAQAYNMIWSASKSAADFYVRKSPPKQQAANSIIGRVQRRAERARDEGWETNPFRRDFRCPRSIVSHVLFSTALHMGDEGFTQAPGPVSEDSKQEA